MLSRRRCCGVTGTHGGGCPAIVKRAAWPPAAWRRRLRRNRDASVLSRVGKLNKLSLRAAADVCHARGAESLFAQLCFFLLILYKPFNFFGLIALIFTNVKFCSSLGDACVFCLFFLQTIVLIITNCHVLM